MRAVLKSMPEKAWREEEGGHAVRKERKKSARSLAQARKQERSKRKGSELVNEEERVS